MKILQFLDHLIPYETFLNDLSSRIVRQLKADKDDPEFISQRKAYELFGRRNVERWKRQGKVVSYKRPGKVEYRTADIIRIERLDISVISVFFECLVADTEFCTGALD